MNFNTLIDRVKNRTIEAIRDEDWEYLSIILDKEPKQLIHYSEEIEKVITRSKILNQFPFELIIY